MSSIKSEYNKEIYNYIHNREEDIIFSGGDWGLTYLTYSKLEPDSEKKYIEWLEDHDFKPENKEPVELDEIKENKNNNYYMRHFNSKNLTTPYNVLDKIGLLSYPNIGEKTLYNYCNNNNLSLSDCYNILDMNSNFKIDSYYEQSYLWNVFVNINNQWNSSKVKDSEFYDLSNILTNKYTNHFNTITKIMDETRADTYGELFVPDYDELIKKIRLHSCDGNQIIMGYETSCYYHMIRYVTS